MSSESNPSAHKHRQPHGGWWLWLILGLMSLSTLVCWAVIELNRPVTFLVLGSDRRAGSIMPSRSDSIFVLRTDPQQHVIRGLALPRDLYVPITGIPLRHKRDRINTALFWGDYYATDGGLDAACRTIGDQIGAPINGAIEVSFFFVEKLIDTLGGVEIYFDKPAADQTFHLLDGQPSPLRFEAGWNFLDGKRALQFVRLRKCDTDFGRMNRNQQLADTLAERLRAPANWLKLPGLLPTLARETDTNLGFMDSLRIAWALYRCGARKIQWDFIGKERVCPAITPRKAQVLVPEPGILKLAGRRLLGEPEHFARAEGGSR